MQKSTHTSEYTLLRSELRRAREKAGLSQRDLALRLKITHSWIAKVETGERRIDLLEFCWFLSACDQDPALAISRLLPKFVHAKGHRTKAGGRGK